MTAHPTHPDQSCTPHLLLIVPSAEGERQAEAMETWIQACADDEPFALELVGTTREQGFVLRCSSERQQARLGKQLQAQYPEAELRQIKESADPLRVGAGERVVIGEFSLTQSSYLPLKTFSGKALIEPGSDPLMGILAAMETVGPGARVICQLALCRAPDTWIAPDLRKAVEHPLQKERDQAQVERQPSAHNGPGVLILLVMLGVLAFTFGRPLLHTLPVFLWFLFGLLVVLAGAGLLFWWIRHQAHPLYDMRLVAEKLLRTAFYAQLRVIVIGRSSVSEEHLRAVVGNIEVAYRQFSLASANSLAVRRVRILSGGTPTTPLARLSWALSGNDTRRQNLTSVLCAFPYHRLVFRLLHGGQLGPDYWNALEIAGAYHPPQELADLPLVQRVSGKHLLFPPQLSDKIAATPTFLLPVRIGTSRHRGHSSPVLVPASTLFRHKLLVGRSRSGKSVLMQHLIRGAMQPVRDNSPQPGVFVIDPHHDLVEDLLAAVPPARIRDVLLLDFTDTGHPVGLNPLDATMGFTRDQAVSNFVSCAEAIWKDSWGLRMAYFIKAVCLLLATLNEQLVRAGRASEQYTILDINPLLQYQDYATRALSALDQSEAWHQELLAWWQHTYFALPKNSSFRQEIIMPILSKMGVFQENQVLRRIVGQPVTTAPVHSCITEGSIVLAALSSQDLDETSVNILGSTLINLLHRAFARQQHLPLMQRRRVCVAIDELQNFSGSQFEKLFAEDAKYGCAMLVSTQSLKRLNQIKDGLQETLFSNCENLWAFSVSAADAKILEEELHRQVSLHHISNQQRLHAYARLSIEGEPLLYTSLEIAAPPSWKETSTPSRSPLPEHIHQQSRARFLSRAEVDALHQRHLTEFLDVSAFAERIKQDVAARTHAQEERTREQEYRRHQPSTPVPSPPQTRSDTPQGIRTAASSFSTAPSSGRAGERKETDGGDRSAQAGEEGPDGAGTAHTSRAGRRNHSRSSRASSDAHRTSSLPLPHPAASSPVSEEAASPRPSSFASPSGRGGNRERGEGRERGA